MADSTATSAPGREHYAALYRSDLELEAEWLRLSAVEKANSVERLVRRNGIESTRLLELGCGTGAVILECMRRGLAGRYSAIDFSPDAIAHLRGQAGDRIACRVADVAAPEFRCDEPFDVVVVSHVLEHLESPGEFLASLRRKIRFTHLVVEVPLENLPALRLKSRFRDRRDNPAGHVQFFTGRDFLRLLSDSGFDVVDRRRYAPVLSERAASLVCRRHGLRGARRLVRLATGRYLPGALGPLWSRLYYAHLAVLCHPTEQSNSAAA